MTLKIKKVYCKKMMHIKNVKNMKYRINIIRFGGGEVMQYCKITLIIVGVLLAIMGIAGLPGVSDMGTEPDWHAILKIIIGAVAVIIALMEKKE